MSDRDENDFLLSSYVISEKDLNIIVDSQSTAFSLVFTNLLLLTTDPARANKSLDRIKSDPKTLKFASKIEAREILSLKDIEDNGELYQAYIDAINSVLKSGESSKKSASIIYFTMTMKPLNNRLYETTYYLNGEILALDKNAQSEFKNYLNTEYFNIGREVAVYITNETRFSGKKLVDGYNNLEAQIKGHVKMVDTLGKLDKGEGRFFADEVLVY